MNTKKFLVTTRFVWRKCLPLLAGIATVGVCAACLSAGTAPQSAKAQAPGEPLTVTVDVAKSRKPIDPRIYGSAYADDAAIKDLRLPVHRLGGNNTTRYNWRENADNRGSDWFFQSIGDDSATPGERIDSFITKSKANGAEPMITIPVIGYVAKIGANREKQWSFDVKKYGAQEKTDPYNADSGNGKKPDGKDITANNPLDANTPADAAFQKPWIEAIKTKHGAAGANGLRYYILDNEPGIWHNTHRDVHPEGAKMDEVREKSVAMARMIKSVDPAAVVMGPEEWGWTGYLYSGSDAQWGNSHGWSLLPDRIAHGNKDFVAWYLEQMKAAEAKSGKRLLDVFTLHIYPQGGEFSEDVSEEMQKKRNRSTRALFDPAYKDETWIDDTVKLIPRMKEWVASNYPGTQTGITEYNWGAEGFVNGATAQADILGIFGREGLNVGARWTTPKTGSPVYNVMKLFRSYDGKGSAFGETSVSATTNAAYENLTVYASERKSDGAITILLVNKGVMEKPETRQVSLQIAGKPVGVKAKLLRVGMADGGKITEQTDANIVDGKVTLSLPVPSVTLLVVPKG